MDVAQMQEAQSVQAVGKIGNRDLHFSHVEIQALDEHTVAHDGERRGQQRASRGVEQPAARRIESSRAPEPLRKKSHGAVSQVSGGGTEEPNLGHRPGYLRGISREVEAAHQAARKEREAQRECRGHQGVEDRQGPARDQRRARGETASGGSQKLPAHVPLREDDDEYG